MVKKMGVNVVSVFCCMALLSAVGVVNYPPLAGAQGVDSYTKLMLHADGSDQGTSFTDSSSGAKTVTNTESYDSYTKLMLHIENNVTDSAAGKTVTNNNATFSSSVYKMGGYSGVFNGSNAYLSLADSDDWNFGTGDFTIDSWVRFNVATGYQTIVAQYVDINNFWEFYLAEPEGLLKFRQDTGGSATYIVTGSWVPVTNTWYHVAVVRSGNNWYLFVDGVQIGTSVNSINLTDWAGQVQIGYTANAGALNGYLDELRISKGIARWTSDFTPPSSPYGKVATVTSQKKFGTASGEFKGSSAYLSLADSADWNFGSGDFTVDAWVRLNAIDAIQPIFTQKTDNNNYGYFAVYLDNGIHFALFVGGVRVASLWVNVPVTTDTWYHIALTHSGTIYTIFVNGVSKGTLDDTDNWGDYTGNVTIGYMTPDDSSFYYLNGWLDEVRISKGIARWTSNFTPPTAPYETDTTAPTVSSTSPASNATGVGISTAISATFSEDMDSSTITTSTFTLSSSGSVSGTVLYNNKVATFTPSSNLSYSTTYTATITTGVKDSGGNAMSSTYTWSFTTSSAPDTTAPTGSVSGASYTNSSTVTLTLSATDNVGVTGYYLSDSSTTPSASTSGWTSVTSTTSYSGTVSYSLSSGEGSKTIYAWYKDAAGNVSSTANATITYDTTVPTVSISSPTSSSTYTATTSTITLGGSASDSSSGIGTVTWSNNRGGNGTATGTASWTISGISLSSGDNVITVTAKDGAGNSGTDTLQVTYGTSSTVSAPTASTGSASSVTTSSATLNGTVNANGASTTAWFQYGSTSGSYGNTSSTQTVTGSSNTTVSIGISGLLSGTTYYYRVAASNSGGTSYGSEASFTTSTVTATPTPTPSTGDTTTPIITITSPTSSATYTTTSSTITLSGTASDNSGSVSSVTWSNSKGGSGTASGTTSWTISSISLSSGDNVITVTATDGSGNSGTDTITVTYHVTTTPTPTAAPTATITPKPSPTAQPTPTLPPLPTPPPIPLPSPLQEGIVFGFVNDQDELPLKGVTITITGKDSSDSTETDENGYYEFSGLDAGEYAITYEKEGFLAQTQDISLEEGEVEDLGVVILEQIERGRIYGYVVNIKGNPLEFVRLRLKGVKTKVIKTASSDADGFFEFTDLEADTYVIIAKKKKYRNTQQKVKIEEGASEEIEIVMKKTSKRIKELLLEEDIQ